MQKSDKLAKDLHQACGS